MVLRQYTIYDHAAARRPAIGPLTTRTRDCSDSAAHAIKPAPTARALFSRRRRGRLHRPHAPAGPGIDPFPRPGSRTGARTGLHSPRSGCRVAGIGPWTDSRPTAHGCATGRAPVAPRQIACNDAASTRNEGVGRRSAILCRRRRRHGNAALRPANGCGGGQGAAWHPPSGGSSRPWRCIDVSRPETRSRSTPGPGRSAARRSTATRPSSTERARPAPI